MPKTRMLAFGILTAFMLVCLSLIAAYIRRDEIMANWSKYRDDPLYMFAAFMFKPDDDPRSRLGFAMDNFSSSVNRIVMKLFATFLQPIMKIIQGMTGSLEQSVTSVMNMRGLFNNMFNKFTSVTNIFQRRYDRTFHALRMTWTKLRESINKTFGAAVTSLYAGVSAFRVIDNMFRLMTIVSISILSILLGFVVFFFFILWPILPIILIAIGFIAQTPYAGEVMGMESAFCFGANTVVPTTTGNKPIQEVKVGDVLVYGDGTEHATVTGTMAFDADYERLYDLFGVKVSGSHIYYYEDGTPGFVRDHPSATPMGTVAHNVYCLITSNHKIPVVSNNGVILFADWEELDEGEDLVEWNKTVFEMLNRGFEYVAPAPECLQSEAALTEMSHILTPLGPVRLRNLHPGAIVYDADSKPTRVTGIVALDASQITAAAHLDEHTYVSAGTWIRSGSKWLMPQATALAAPPSDKKWYMLFTESGTFRLITSNFQEYAVRDFSDVGAKEISKTYEMVLTALRAKTAHYE